MERYSLLPQGLVADKTGNWMRYADHRREVEGLEKELKEAKASCDMWKREAYLIGDALKPLCNLDDTHFGWKPAIEIISTKLADLQRQIADLRESADTEKRSLLAQLEAAREELDENTEVTLKALAHAGEQVAQLTAEREEAWLHFAATGSHEDFLYSLGDIILRDYLQGEELKKLRGLVEALPVVEGDIDTVCYGICDWRINKGGGMFAVESDAEAFAALLRYRATLAQTKGEQ